MKIQNIAICSLLVVSFFAGANATLHGNEILADRNTWDRIPGQKIGSGMRVMIVNPNDVTPDDKAACRARIGSIAKVYSVGNGGEGEELVVLDNFGLGKVKAVDVILLRQSDVFEQIEDRIPKSHRGIALAEFEALYDMAKARRSFRSVLKRNPANEEFKTRYALFLWKHSLSDELAKLKLEEHTQDDNERLVIASALLPVGQRIDRLQAIAKRDQNSLFARTALASALETQLLSPNEKSNVAFLKLDYCADEINELVPDHPDAYTQIIACSIDRSLKGGSVDVDKYWGRLKKGEQSARRFPYNHNLLVALTEGNLAASNLVEASQFAMAAVTKFPISCKSVELVRACFNELEVAGIENQAVSKFGDEYKIGYLISGFNGADPADFYTGKLPHVSLIDGTAPISLEESKDTSQRRGIAKLCSEDQIECLRFLNAFVPDSISSASAEELFEACVESGSYHAMELLLSAGKKPENINRLFQRAIENEHDVMILQLREQNGGEFTQACVDSYTKAFDVSSGDMQNELTKKSIVRFQSELRGVFAQAIAMKKLAVEDRRSIESTYAQLERIAAHQQVYGDSYGLQQTNAGIRQLKQQLRDNQKVSNLANSLAKKNLNAEYEVIKEILDPAGLDEWLVATEKHVDQELAWFGTKFDRWKARR